MEARRRGGCSSEGKAGHLLIGRDVVQTLVAPICFPNIQVPLHCTYWSMNVCELRLKSIEEGAGVSIGECSGRVEKHVIG
ncbi:hypothetical protein NL344_27875, partial [Klebsiella pneumoniae]|nr:hypothetical protein [Klebsiella pneumoniae]